jgi:hypothetical protein
LQAHLKATRAIATPKLLKELAKTNFVDLDEKISSHPDNFKNTSYNSDGLINCLRQPGQLHYQPPKSMVLNLSQLIKIRYRDSSCCLDTVYWAAGLCAAGTSFCRAIWQLYRDPKLCAVNRDSSIYWDYPIWQFYRDPKLSAVNRDYPISTALSGHRNFQPSTGTLFGPKRTRPSTGILQKLMPARAAGGNIIKPPGRYGQADKHIDNFSSRDNLLDLFHFQTCILMFNSLSFIGTLPSKILKFSRYPLHTFANRTC